MVGLQTEEDEWLAGVPAVEDGPSDEDPPTDEIDALGESE